MTSVLTKNKQSFQQGENSDHMFKKLNGLRQLKEDGNKYLQFMLDCLYSSEDEVNITWYEKRIKSCKEELECIKTDMTLIRKSISSIKESLI